MSKTFYLTVGQRYRHQSHPLGIHPDGYGKIIANNYEEAHEKVTSVIGWEWANLYDEDSFDSKLYTRGCQVIL